MSPPAAAEELWDFMSVSAVSERTELRPASGTDMESFSSTAEPGPSAAPLPSAAPPDNHYLTTAAFIAALHPVKVWQNTDARLQNVGHNTSEPETQGNPLTLTLTPNPDPYPEVNP